MRHYKWLGSDSGFYGGGSETPHIYLIETVDKTPKTQRVAVEIRTFPKERVDGK